jgi:hypothetical protein
MKDEPKRTCRSFAPAIVSTADDPYMPQASAALSLILRYQAARGQEGTSPVGISPLL